MDPSMMTDNYIVEDCSNPLKNDNSEDIPPNTSHVYAHTILNNSDYSPDNSCLEQQVFSSVNETSNIIENKGLPSVNLTDMQQCINKATHSTPMDVSISSFGLPNTTKKLSSQVILKLLSDDSLNLDILKIMSEEGIEKNTADSSNNFQLSKLSDPILKIDVLASNESDTFSLPFRNETEQNVVWSCTYCSMEFNSQELAKCHIKKECKMLFKSSAAIPKNVPNENNNTSLIEAWTGQDFTVENIQEKSDSCDWESFWTCVICCDEFNDSLKLNEHFITHNSQDLAAALMKTIQPQYKLKKKIEKLPNPPKNTMETSIAAPNILIDNDNCEQLHNTAAVEKLEATPKDTHKNIKSKKTDLNKPKKTYQTNKNTNRPKSLDPHACGICNKVLTSRGNLKKHMVIHSATKPWTCNECNVGFNTSRDYKNHIIVKHTNEKKFSCDQCETRCASKRDLEIHKLFHQSYSVSCDLCGKLFKSHRCVNKHRKRHNRDQQFICLICFKSFHVKDDLTSHYRKMHNKSRKDNGKSKKKVLFIDPAPTENQLVKNKDIYEFLFPDKNDISFNENPQFISSDLVQSCIDTPTVAPNVIEKRNDENFFTIVPLKNQPNESLPDESNTLTDQETYVMINNTNHSINEVNSNLNIIYSTSAMQVEAVKPNQELEMSSDVKGHSQIERKTNQIPNESIEGNAFNHTATIDEIVKSKDLTSDSHLCFTLT